MPQGSVLGPLLFILYINDLYHVAKSTHVILFADDTNLFSSHEKLDKMEKELNDELLLINNWFKANKLSVNASKTNYILLGNNTHSNHIL